MPQRAPALRTLAAYAFAGIAALDPLAAWSANQTTPFSKIPHLFFNNPTPAPMLAPSAVIARYESALGDLASPRYLAFTFSIEQSGAHNLSQTHHVYRDGPNERDETTIADGVSLRRPNVRIFRNRTYRYQVNEVAPRPGDYAFRLTGTQHDGDHDDYSFATSARNGGTFQVTNVIIDGDRFLPLEVDFTIGAGSLRGQGRLTYGRYDRYWLVRDAEVAAHDASGKASRERIVWMQYQFPDSLPASTFNNARSAPPDEGFSASSGPSSPEPSPKGDAGPRTPPPARPQPSSVASVTPAAATPKPSKSQPPAGRPPPRTSAPSTAATASRLQSPVTPAPLRTEPPLSSATQPPALAPAPVPAETAAPGASGSP